MKKFLKTFDFTHGLLGAIGMASVVFFINSDFTIKIAATAALAQSIISFLIVGTNTGVFKKLYTNSKLKAIFVPTIFTTFIATIIHYITNTPQLFWTIATVFLLATIHFVILSVIHKQFGTINPRNLFIKTKPN